MMTNISRHIDYMTTNVKYIFTQGIETNNEIFADKYLSTRFCENLTRARLNCSHLTDHLDVVCEIVGNRTKSINNNNNNLLPIDSVSGTSEKKHKNKWYKSPLKITAITTITLSTLFICKTKFFH
jgi:hypothetical protein